MGSVLVGKRDFIERARHFRKVFGGGWRQSGILAAACLHAIDHHWARMAEDHENAAFLGKGLAALGFQLTCPVETNMVWVDTSALKFTTTEWAEALKEKGILVGTKGAHEARLVVHLQVSKDALKKVLEVTEKFIVNRK